MSPCHILTVGRKLDDESSLSTQCAVQLPPPSTRPNSLEQGLQVYVQTHLFTAFQQQNVKLFGSHN